VPVALPLAVGAKLTLTVHDPPAAMELPQELVSLNGGLALTDDTDAAAQKMLLASVIKTIAATEPLSPVLRRLHPGPTSAHENFSTKLPNICPPGGIRPSRRSTSPSPPRTKPARPAECGPLSAGR
jgi:hypothetical protein